MIQYSSINDAWGITDKKKESFSSSKQENKHIKNSNDTESCNIIEHVSKCQECKNKLKELFIIEHYQSTHSESEDKESNVNKTPINKEPIYERMYNTTMNKITENRELTIFILITLIVIILVLLIHSYRKPIELSNQKGFYIFPEDLAKIRSLIELKTIQ